MTDLNQAWVNKKILIIDDSQTVRRSAEVFLQPTQAQLFFAIDGIDGLDQVFEHKPDIVFCDVLMPRADGYQTCTVIKHNPQFSSIPVILMTGKDGHLDKARGVLSMADHYLVKPFKAQDMIDLCQLFFGATS